MKKKYLIDKKRVKASFSKAFNTYDEVAHWQKEVGKRLLELFRADDSEAKNLVLDIGTGTGFLAMELLAGKNVRRTVGCDISRFMVKRACEKNNRGNFFGISGDAEALPFKADSFDYVLSNMAYHWIGFLSTAFRETSRVLKSGGGFIFSIVLQETLKDLEDAYNKAMERHYPAAAKKSFHPFPRQSEVENTVAHAGFRLRKTSVKDFDIPYRSMEEMLRSFNALGVSNVSPATQGGLLGRNFTNYLLDYYPNSMKKENRILGRYRVFYVLAEKRD